MNSGLKKRQLSNTYRTLMFYEPLIDFSSNDYLGFCSSQTLYNAALDIVKSQKRVLNGASGSRLITGNYPLYEETEKYLACFHSSEDCLLFNSGYDANIGFFSCIPQRGDVVFYDECIHASIRDGLRLSHAKAYKFKHNNIAHLKSKLKNSPLKNATIYIVTESIFSMDGDHCDLKALSDLSTEFNAKLIVDEAHALGVIGSGKGLVQDLQLEHTVFARIFTFGKALGCHGACVLSNTYIKNYLINFARSFIYTTALPPHSVATILAGYNELEKHIQFNDRSNSDIIKLQYNIKHFRKKVHSLGLKQFFIDSHSAIQACLLPKEYINEIVIRLQYKGYGVKGIKTPTVPLGKERIRICIHSFNSISEIDSLLFELQILIIKIS